MTTALEERPKLEAVTVPETPPTYGPCSAGGGAGLAATLHPAPPETPAAGGGLPTESFTFGLPTMWVAAGEVILGIALLLLDQPSFAVPFLLFGVSAPMRKATEPYEIRTTKAGTVCFLLPLRTLEVPAADVLTLVRFISIGSEGGEYPRLRITTSNEALVVSRCEAAERLISRFSLHRPGVRISGAWRS